MIKLEVHGITKEIGRLVGGLMQVGHTLLTAALATHRVWGEQLRADLAKSLDKELEKQAQDVRTRYMRYMWINRKAEFSTGGGNLTKPIAGMSLKEIEEFAHFYFWKQRVQQTLKRGGDVSKFTFTEDDEDEINPPSIRHSKYETPYNHLPAQDMHRMFPKGTDLVKLQSSRHEVVLLFEPAAMHRSFPGQMMGDWGMPANKEPPIRMKNGKETMYRGDSKSLNQGYQGSMDIFIRPNDPIFVNQALVKITASEMPKALRMLKTEHEKKTFYRLKNKLRQYGYEV